MSAPKGNQFWKLRNRHGRSKRFASPEQLWEAVQIHTVSEAEVSF